MKYIAELSSRITKEQKAAQKAETLARALKLLADGVEPAAVSLRMGLRKHQLARMLLEDKQRRGELPPAKPRIRKPYQPTGQPRFGGKLYELRKQLQTTAGN